MTVKNLPWIMCQQGEGIGTAPSADIINTCNGYYCDNWISRHTKAFPNQPHMFTENWPGWFQNWGQAIPHRPAVDVAFSVARWFARGGSYMTYYMAFGGSNYGRHVGGPLIVTSYDYDVMINEFAMKSEPKYSLLSALHHVVLDNVRTLLTTIPQATTQKGTDYCEIHKYENKEVGNTGCLMFLSNYDASHTCMFTDIYPSGESKFKWVYSVDILFSYSADVCSLSVSGVSLLVRFLSCSLPSLVCFRFHVFVLSISE
jgi:hypothetical protein